MSIYVLKEYVEKCMALGKEATFEGLKKYYSELSDEVLNNMSKDRQ